MTVILSWNSVGNWHSSLPTLIKLHTKAHHFKSWGDIYIGQFPPLITSLVDKQRECLVHTLKALCLFLKVYYFVSGAVCVELLQSMEIMPRIAFVLRSFFIVYLWPVIFGEWRWMWRILCVFAHTQMLYYLSYILKLKLLKRTWNDKTTTCFRRDAAKQITIK